MKNRSKKTAYVACQGGCRATAECKNSCVGCGVCVSVCPFEAIEKNALGVAVVLTERCIGCGKCAKECPRGVIRIRHRGNPIVVACSSHEVGKIARGQCEVSCIGCGICEKTCTAGAIRVQENLAVIDECLCLSCGQCLVKCPRGAIWDVRGIYKSKRQ